MRRIGITAIILLMLTMNVIAIEENVTEDISENITEETDANITEDVTEDSTENVTEDIIENETNVTEVPLTPEGTMPAKTPILEKPFETTVPPKPTEAPGFEGIVGVIGLILMVILRKK